MQTTMKIQVATLLVLSVIAMFLMVTVVTKDTAEIPVETPTERLIKETVHARKVVVFSKSYCPYCARAKALLGKLKVDTHVIELDQTENGHLIQQTLGDKFTKSYTVPSIWFAGEWFGGSDKLLQAHGDGSLAKLLTSKGIDFTPEKNEL